MNANSNVFFDTNCLLYLQTQDTVKIASLEQKLTQGGIVSVQVLNEVFNVCHKKLKLTPRATDIFLDSLKEIFDVEPITVKTHELGVLLSQRYNFSPYDAMIVASALIAQCTILYSEDMQHGLVVQNRLTIVNPFK